MKNTYPHSAVIKEKIIEATIPLIERSDGFVENITVRDIAAQAGVATGLISYHFGSKKNLIEICVQRMIADVMKQFSEEKTREPGPIEETKDSHSDLAQSTVRIFDYLIQHPEICKISMLGDLSEPSLDSNSAVSFRAIDRSMPEGEPHEIQKIKAFILLATIQSAFLNCSISAELLGFDLNKKEDFTQFFSSVAKILNL